jgi:hypothetical protein
LRDARLFARVYGAVASVGQLPLLVVKVEHDAREPIEIREPASGLTRLVDGFLDHNRPRERPELVRFIDVRVEVSFGVEGHGSLLAAALQHPDSAGPVAGIGKCETARSSWAGNGTATRLPAGSGSTESALALCSVAQPTARHSEPGYTAKIPMARSARCASGRRGRGYSAAIGTGPRGCLAAILRTASISLTKAR